MKVLGDVAFAPRMRGLLGAALLLHALTPTAEAASRLRKVRNDPIVAAVEASQAVTQVPCACECCQVIERLPNQYVTKANGEIEKETCSFPVFPEDGEIRLSETAETERCPRECVAPEVLATTTTDAPGPIKTLVPSSQSLLRNTTVQLSGLPYVIAEDFCTDACVPIVPDIGTKCQSLSDVTTTSLLPASNLGAPTGMQPEGKDSSFGFGTEGSSDSGGPSTEILVTTPKPKGMIDFDLRPLVAGRLRAEAGAVMAHAALSGQHVKAAALSTKLDAGLTEKLQPVAAAAEGTLTGLGAGADQSSSAALLSADEATATMKKAEEEAPKLFAETRKLAMDAIQKKAAAAADAEATLYAQRKAWDKPPSWGKLVAYRAAEPYGQMAAIAKLRETQYAARAKDLDGQAVAVRASVQEIPAHAAAMEALGDKLGAAAEREKIQVAMQQASDLEREAERSRGVAEEAAASEARWQTASNEAVQKAWDIYQANHPPEPITINLPQPPVPR
eukprot:TRINITY_DN92094_c0_g1_i1.p1 TRINITY_DN92094_c0_g1~~TRINITY_DN92094_c0_g1_i1.p1  ORF type:complete len:504 (-),score=127.01 TRINITY_DN92094_c0_g1_i1:147-1658(-)